MHDADLSPDPVEILSLDLVFSIIHLTLTITILCNIVLLLMLHTAIVERVLILLPLCLVTIPIAVYTLIISIDRTRALTSSLVLVAPSWMIMLVVSFIFQRRVAYALRNKSPDDDVRWTKDTLGWIVVWALFLGSIGWLLMLLLTAAYSASTTKAAVEESWQFSLTVPIAQSLVAASLFCTTLFTWIPVLKGRAGGIRNFAPRYFYQHLMLTGTCVLFVLSLLPHWILRGTVKFVPGSRTPHEDHKSVWVWPSFIFVSSIIPELWVLFVCSTRVGWLSLVSRGWLEWIGDRMGVVLAEWDEDEDAPEAPPLRLDRVDDDLRKVVQDIQDKQLDQQAKGTVRIVEGRAMQNEPPRPAAALIRMPLRKPRRRSTLGDWATLLRIT